MSRLRWNPLLGEWVILSPRRSGRPFQEEEQLCPFCPGQPETEGDWDVLTLDNKFPALSQESGIVPLDENVVMDAPGYGLCKVILLSRDHQEQVERMDDEQLGRVFKEYLEVFKEIDSRAGISYVVQFENRGRAIGVSLDHPHAQVYALPFIPPRVSRELEQSKKFWEGEETCLICKMLENELKSLESRIITETERFVSLVPFSARLPYEVHIYPRFHAPSLLELEEHLLELGQIVRDTVLRYSKVFDEIAYSMVFHTRPTVGEHPYWHFHVEFYPPWRDRVQLKYLAGIELGAGTYTNDSIPEETARELREAV
ncbi:MAG: galactose-1-phosphate uridylyltransferase [Candidatus Thorarchaeota archaeon]|jgi:UDPglucose--hexose-1-phosphate uridylyltransferase